jgi:GNAT superfamily N-acetyltransferase
MPPDLSPALPYTIRAARPEDEEACWEVEARCWSVFHSEATEEDYYDPALHVVAVTAAGVVVATGNAVPFPRWSGDVAELAQIGWGDVQQDWRRLAERLAEGHAESSDESPAESGAARTTRYACAIGISVLPEARGLGLPMLSALRAAVAAAGYEALAAPVRPTQKWRMAGLSYADYAEVRLRDGSHFDPWLRLHERAGGRVVAVAERSFTMSGSQAQWEEWTRIRLPVEGQVLVEGGNEPLVLAGGRGEIVEGSVWVLHELH